MKVMKNEILHQKTDLHHTISLGSILGHIEKTETIGVAHNCNKNAIHILLNEHMLKGL